MPSHYRRPRASSLTNEYSYPRSPSPPRHRRHHSKPRRKGPPSVQFENAPPPGAPSPIPSSSSTLYDVDNNERTSSKRHHHHNRGHSPDHLHGVFRDAAENLAELVDELEEKFLVGYYRAKKGRDKRHRWDSKISLSRSPSRHRGSPDPVPEVDRNPRIQEIEDSDDGVTHVDDNIYHDYEHSAFDRQPEHRIPVPQSQEKPMRERHHINHSATPGGSNSRYPHPKPHFDEEEDGYISDDDRIHSPKYSRRKNRPNGPIRKSSSTPDLRRPRPTYPFHDQLIRQESSPSRDPSPSPSTSTYTISRSPSPTRSHSPHDHPKKKLRKHLMGQVPGLIQRAAFIVEVMDLYKKTNSTEGLAAKYAVLMLLLKVVQQMYREYTLIRDAERDGRRVGEVVTVARKGRQGSWSWLKTLRGKKDAKGRK